MKAILKYGLVCLISMLAHVAYAETEATLRVQSFNATGTRNLDDRNSGFNMATQATIAMTQSTWQAYIDVTGAAQNGSYDVLEWQSREAYAGLKWNDGLLRVGRQIISSGRADGFNPTDVMTPWNRTRLSLGDNWQRDGRLAAFIKQDWADYSFRVMAFHDNRYDTLPKPPLSGLVINKDTQWRDAYAMRVDYSGTNLEGGLIAYTGADLQPSFDVTALALGRIQETHTRSQLMGADAAGTIKSVAWRGELACVRTASATTNSMWIRKPQCQAVFGLDRSWDSSNLLLQIAHIQVQDWQQANTPLYTLFAAMVGQGQAQQTLLSARVATAFYNEALQLELPCSLGLQASDYACKPRIKWTVSDNLVFHMGADVYAGSQLGYLGRLKDNTLAMLGIELVAP